MKHKQYSFSPQAIHELQQYVNERIMPQMELLRCLIRNKIPAAFEASSQEERLLLFEILNYMYDEMPPECWGSKQAVHEWINPDYFLLPELNSTNDAFRWGFCLKGNRKKIKALEREIIDAYANHRERFLGRRVGAPSQEEANSALHLQLLIESYIAATGKYWVMQPNGKMISSKIPAQVQADINRVAGRL